MARILLVEDHSAVRELLCDVLGQAGHELDCAATCEEAERLLAAGGHQMLIADVGLPDGSGIDLADKILASGKKALLITGHADAMRVLAGRGLAYLRKPFRPSKLVQAVDRQLGSP